MPRSFEKLWGANTILNSTCGLLDMLKLIQMLSVMIRITGLAETGDFPKYAFLLRVSVVYLWT